jgi:GT2 family glycosyltransferase
MLTNPEVPHTLDILKAVDKEDMSNLYIICACKSVFVTKDNGSVNSNEYRTHMWYQHTAYRDVKYHFCTFISRENYGKIGGFDERFCAGIAYDDDNFVRRVQRANIFMVPRDDLVTYHIEHPRSYGISAEEYHRLTQVNLKIWASQVATENF